MKAAGRRAEIIEAVLQLVNVHGVQGVTTARIASAIGVTEPTLYTYFDSRQDMLMTALDTFLDRVEDMLTLKPGADPVEHLRSIGRGHTEETTGKKIGFVRLVFEFILSPPELGLRARVSERQLAAIDLWKAAVEEGKKQGQIRPDVDSTRVAWRILGFHWIEDMSSLLDLPQIVNEGITTEMFTAIIDDIVARP